MKRAALYIRVSTQEQAQEGYSVGEQKERLLAYCKAHDWGIADIYVDGGYSGSNLKRPAIQKLINETDKFDIVLVYKLDRLSRSQRDTLYLIEEVFLPSNVDFVSMRESFDTATPFGKATIGLLAVFAQLEREQIKERTKMGRIARAKAGLYRGGGKVPIGYERVDGHLVVLPYEAEQVKKIFKMYIAGESLYGIWRSFREAGYTTRYGDYSSWSSIRNILRNDVYTGKFHYGEVTYLNAHEPLVSESDFKLVQARIAQSAEKMGHSAYNSKHLLTGLLFCGNCGARYFLRTASKSAKYRYYVCYSRSRRVSNMIKDPNCKNKIWKADELEGLIKDKVREVLQSTDLAREIAESRKHKTELPKKTDASTEKRIKEIDQQVDRLMKLYQLDDMPADILSANINRLYKEKELLQETLEPEEKHEESKLPFDLAEELLADAAQVWDFADEAQQRRIMQSVIKKITLNDDRVDIDWAF